MKTKRDVLKEFKVYNEIVHDTPLLELIEDAMEYYAKQKLNLSGRVNQKKQYPVVDRTCPQTGDPL